MALAATVGDQYRRAQEEIAAFKTTIIGFQSQLAAGPTSAYVVRAILEGCVAHKARLNALKAIGGIGDYAKTQEGDDTYDADAAIEAVVAKIDALVAEIASTIPTGTGGYVLTETWTSSGVAVRTFTAAQTLAVRNAIQDLAAEIA